jgi:hypothetical protein
MKFKEFLDEAENSVLHIKRRLFFLTSFEKALRDLTRQKPFTIWNDIVWRSSYDVWDMLVIDLASLTKGMVSQGGFFNSLQANSHMLKPIPKKSMSAPPGTIHSLKPISALDRRQLIAELDRSFVDMMYQHNREALFRLFPNLKGRQPFKINHQDISDLKDRFALLAQEIENDRNAHRAHRYEREENTTATRLSIEKLKTKFEEIESLLNDLKLTFEGAQLGFLDMNFASTEETAKDLVFMILFGSQRTIDMSSEVNLAINSPPEDRHRYGYQLREEMLQRCHDLHDGIVSGHVSSSDIGINKPVEKINFNDLSYCVMRKS